MTVKLDFSPSQQRWIFVDTQTKSLVPMAGNWFWRFRMDALSDASAEGYQVRPSGEAVKWLLLSVSRVRRSA